MLRQPLAPIPPRPRVAAINNFLVAHRRSLALLSCLALGVLGVVFLIVSTRGVLAENTAIDFHAYWRAALAIRTGDSPYLAGQLTGPIGPMGLDLYRYPPALAVLLVPLSLLGSGPAYLVWSLASGLAFWLAIMLALRAGGTGLSWRSSAAGLVGLILFFPVFDSLWKGNLEGFEALLLAVALVGGVRAGAASTALAWLKVAPVLVIPAALLAGGRRAWLGFGAVCVAVALTIPLAPTAWADLGRVLLNEAGGDPVLPQNFAPAVVLGGLVPGYPGLIFDLRLLVFASVAGLIVSSLWLARRPAGWPLALTAAIYASLLAPGTLWFHYTAVLLVPVAYAWPRADGLRRTELLAALGLIAFGPANRPLFLVGLVVLGLLLARLLTPEGRPKAGIDEPVLA